MKVPARKRRKSNTINQPARNGLLVHFHDGPPDEFSGLPCLPGFYIWIWHRGDWRTDVRLRFVRQRDAQMATDALTKAGLDTVGALSNAGMEAIRIAFEALQW
jgi:hypothetical protein